MNFVKVDLRLDEKVKFTFSPLNSIRNFKFSSNLIKYEINIGENSNKRHQRGSRHRNSRRYSQLSTRSKRTEMTMLVKEIIRRNRLQKTIIIEEENLERPVSQLSTSLSTSGRSMVFFTVTYLPKSICIV